MTEKQPTMKTYSGVTIDDPTIGVEDQSSFRITPSPIRIDAPNGENDLNRWPDFRGTLLLLSIQEEPGNMFYIQGTATMIGCGVAVTATHTIKPYIHRLAGGSMLLMLSSAVEDELILWHCHAMTHTTNPDMVILLLNLRSRFPPSREIVVPRIRLTLPQINSRVFLAGFRSEKEDGSFEKEAGQLSAAGRIKVSAGPLTKVYPNGRDSAMISWPCLEIATTCSGGLSGGPAFDEEGFLLGIVCTSMAEEGGRGTTYASLIWPALVPKVDLVWPKGAHLPNTSLFKQEASVYIDRPDAFEDFGDNVRYLL